MDWGVATGALCTALNVGALIALYVDELHETPPTVRRNAVAMAVPSRVGPRMIGLCFETRPPTSPPAPRRIFPRAWCSSS